MDSTNKIRLGRPKQSDAERQKKIKRIVDSAEHLFSSEGYQAVSMRRLAQQAGMGTMTLYKYFTNKHAILQQLWQVFFAEVLNQPTSRER